MAWTDALMYVACEELGASDGWAAAELERPSTAYLCLLRRAMEQCADPSASAPLLLRSAATGAVMGTWRHPAGPRASLASTCVLERAQSGGAGSANGWCAPSKDGVGDGFAELPLPALLAEVGMRIEPPWSTFEAVGKVDAKLQACGVDTTTKLAELLSSEGTAALNQRVKSRGGTAFRARSLGVMRELLLGVG